MKDGDIIQIAHVVTDVDETMKNYYETFGYGPWDVYDFKAPLLRESRYRGKPATHEYIVAVTWVQGIQLELMQPVKGYSIYNEYLEQNKGGFHDVRSSFKTVKRQSPTCRKKDSKSSRAGKSDRMSSITWTPRKFSAWFGSLAMSGKCHPSRPESIPLSHRRHWAKRNKN